jgi:hypothetical protein
MCHFITAVLPQGAKVSELDDVARRHGRQFQPQPNASVEAKLRPGERHFLTTLGHCDCGTSLGERARQASGESRSHDAEAKRLRARGWSETKISRWLAQKRETAARDARVQATENVAQSDDWLPFLREVAESQLTSYVGLLVHWYSGPLTGRVTLHGREVVALSPDTLADIKEDVLYEFKT